VLVEPSPKVHDQDVGLPVDVSVNVIVCAVTGAPGAKVKAVVNAVPAGFMMTFQLTELDPVALPAVRVTVNVPAAE